jgi:DNA-directed RNA polymerase subunit F
MQKSEGLRLTDREVIVQFCTEKLEMGSRKIGDLLGISYTTVCEIRKKIEKKKKRKLELTQEKPKQYAQLFEICRPKQYRKSVYNSIKNV